MKKDNIGIHQFVAAVAIRANTSQNRTKNFITELFVKIGDHLEEEDRVLIHRFGDSSIKGYKAIVNQETVGLPVSVFVMVSLEKQVEDVLEDFEKRIRVLPEVMECYLMTGDMDYLLRVVTLDIRTYEHFLVHDLTKFPGVRDIKSSFALKQVVYRTALPV